MPLNDAGVFSDLDAAPPRMGKGLPIAVLGEKAPDVLPRLPQGAVGQHQKLNHVAGVVPEPFHRQQVLPGDGQMEGLQFRLLSLIASTAGPYRATRRALTIRLNASVSTTSLLARSARATPDPSA